MLGIRQGKSTQNGGKRPALWAFRQCANNRVPQQIRNCIWRGIFAGQGGGRRWAGARQGRQRRYGGIRPGGKCNFPAWRNTGRRRGQAVKNRGYSGKAENTAIMRQVKSRRTCGGPAVGWPPEDFLGPRSPVLNKNFILFNYGPTKIPPPCRRVWQNPAWRHTPPGGTICQKSLASFAPLRGETLKLFSGSRYTGKSLCRPAKAGLARFLRTGPLAPPAAALPQKRQSRFCSTNPRLKAQPSGGGYPVNAIPAGCRRGPPIRKRGLSPQWFVRKDCSSPIRRTLSRYW